MSSSEKVRGEIRLPWSETSVLGTFGAVFRLIQVGFGRLNMADVEQSEDLLRQIQLFEKAESNLKKLNFFETARTFLFLEFGKSKGRDRIPLVRNKRFRHLWYYLMTYIGRFQVAENGGRRKS